MVFPTIFTPQGDGNEAKTEETEAGTTEFPTIFTPQGDGNPNPSNTSRLNLKQNSRQYLPRKGTETVAVKPVVQFLPPPFPTIFTPQGDGNYRLQERLPQEQYRLQIPDNIYPARGRKPF